MRYLILGATGTLGLAMIKELLKTKKTVSIKCLSRDELKLSQLSSEFNDKRIETVIGDIRDKDSIINHYAGIDVVFHFAALKRIPELEKYPHESLKTNVLGTINSAECALVHKVKHFIFSSTDKACKPVNTYGACKFLSEQMLFNYNKYGITNFSVYRWGNVLGSRGSVLYSFQDSVNNDREAHITHPDMTRFWIKIEDAIQFILDTYTFKKNEVRVPTMKAASVLDLLSVIGHLKGKKSKHAITGMRPGEKIHEDILYHSNWGSTQSSNNSEYYSLEELIELVRGIV